MQRVLVVDHEGKALMPCHPARARKLLTQGRARVLRQAPFTIQLTDRVGGERQTAVLKIDLGSRTTGLAVVVPTGNGWRLIWAAEIHHRGAEVHLELVKRAGVRRNRRSRKTRYRAPRFANRRCAGVAAALVGIAAGKHPDLGQAAAALGAHREHRGGERAL